MTSLENISIQSTMYVSSVPNPSLTLEMVFLRTIMYSYNLQSLYEHILSEEKRNTSSLNCGQ